LENVHKAMMRTANRCLPSLKTAIQVVGPVQMTVRSDLPLPLYLSRSVVGQQLSGKAASTIWGRVERHCEELGLSLGETVSRDGLQWLRGCGVSGSKSRAIGAIFDARDQGLLEIPALAGMSHEERSAQVSSIWGIGQWTCDMLSMFYFADVDVWPRADTSANRELAGFLDQDALPGETWETWEAAERFRPYRSYLALYMWRIADTRVP